jgi:hypothetical protein
MKTKFLLALLTLTGLLLGTNSAFASTISSTENSQNMTNLSQRISKSIDLNGDYHSLIELAIDRALLAKGEKTSPTQPNIAVGEPYPNGPIINGKIAQPTPRNNPPVIINGIIKKVDPPTKPSEDRKPRINGVIINGVIANPAR